MKEQKNERGSSRRVENMSMGHRFAVRSAKKKNGLGPINGGQVLAAPVANDSVKTGLPSDQRERFP